MLYDYGGAPTFTMRLSYHVRGLSYVRGSIAFLTDLNLKRRTLPD